MNTMLEKLLPSNAYWRYFLQICSIPHPSGHEERLRDFLCSEAEKYHLAWRVDAAGNLAVDRPAAAGFESAPLIILQAHMDMVPQVAEGVTFDFLHDPIPVAVDGDWVHTNSQTTLGADDGMGIALAMELLTDPELQCGALRGVFTVAEEIGLIGAGNIDRAFLDGGILCNLDSEKVFTIGCAGGARFAGEAVLESTAAGADMIGIQVTLNGMHGGHSGEDIQCNYGSAARELGFIAAEWQEVIHLAAVNIGKLDNVIAPCGSFTGALESSQVAKLRRQAADIAQKLNEKFIPADGMQITLEMAEIPCPEKVLTAQSQQKLLKLWNNLPHGLLAAAPDGSSESSCNLAIIHGQAGENWQIVELARSLYNDRRTDIAEKAMELMRNCSFDSRINSAYTSWPPRYESKLLEKACSLYFEVTGKTAVKSVTHGGLEAGFFSGLNPGLEMLSFAPKAEFIHSVQERLSISSSEEIRRFLRRLVIECGK